jgi:uracil-DNA glycosylase family 4
MEQQFKKILQKTKAQKEQKDPLFKTFEGALFSESSWFFHFQDNPISLSENAPTKIEKKIEIKGITPLIQVLFVGDSFDGNGEDLLGKMIGAMKLSSNEFFRFPMQESLDEVSDLAMNAEVPNNATKDLYDIIELKRPEIVVSLGATVTNILLGKREKLSTIHGQFFEKKIGECVYNLMPIFHPDFLQINPNMKRTAWIDLQKVMERIGKI